MLGTSLKEASLIVVLVVVGSALCGIVLTKLFKFSPDNPVEEICEEVIETYTGVDVDLSPETPEGKPKQEEEKKEKS